MVTDPNPIALGGFIDWLKSDEGVKAAGEHPLVKTALEYAHGRDAVINPPAPAAAPVRKTRMEIAASH